MFNVSLLNNIISKNYIYFSDNCILNFFGVIFNDMKSENLLNLQYYDKKYTDIFSEKFNAENKIQLFINIFEEIIKKINDFNANKNLLQYQLEKLVPSTENYHKIDEYFDICFDEHFCVIINNQSIKSIKLMD